MVGVVLEGGGAKGAYQAGALKALNDRHIKINGIVGTSIGSINAAFACTGEYDKLIHIWKSTTTNDLLGIDDELINKIANKKFDKRVIKNAFLTAKSVLKNSGINTDKIRKLLTDNLDEEKLRNSEMDFGLVTYNVTDKKPIEVFKEDIPKGMLIDYLIASSYLPIFKSEKIIDQKKYADGGFYDNLPISLLQKKGYKTIYAIRTHGIGKIKKINIGDDEQIIYINPTKKLGNIIYFDPEKSSKNIKYGYYDTLKVLDNLDGKNYYFKSKSEEYYSNILSKINSSEISKLKRKLKVKTNKDLIITILEETAKEYLFENFKVYKVPSLIFKLKFTVREKDKYYKFIRKLKIRF